MPRRPLIRSDVLPYDVTARANNQEAFSLPLEKMWEILAHELYLSGLTYGIEVHAFVLMPNHFHLLITLPREDLGIVMRDFLSYVTRTVNLKSGRSGRVFGSRYYWSLINSGRYYAHALKYVYRNPIKAELCTFAEDYPFSTVQGLVGKGIAHFPLFYPRSGNGLSFDPLDHHEFFEWLNCSFPYKVEQSIKSGFRRTVFEIPKEEHTRSLPDWVDSLI